MSAWITWLQRSLPKPLLFGLYGAVGALLGALLLGEVLWAALKPPPPASNLPPAALRITASEAMSINQADKNRFTVRVVRDYFEGPVVLKCRDLPEGITAQDVKLNPEETEAELELTADTNAQLGEHEFTVAAEAPDHPNKPTATSNVQVTVIKSEWFTASAALGINQADKNQFTVRVVRSFVKGPVELKCLNLPKGVSSKDVTLDSDKSEIEIELAADSEAEVGESSFQISAEATEHPGTLSANAPVQLTVVKSIWLTTSKELGVNQGDKNQFTVRIVRSYFEGPVVLKCLDLPKGVTAKDVTMDSEKSIAEMEVVADADAEPGVFLFKVSGEAQGRTGKLATSGPIRLTVVKVTPPGPPIVDIVFVLDSTASMQGAIDGVTKGILDFANDLAEKKLDARVGLLAFRDLSAGEASQQLDFEGTPFTNDYQMFRRMVGRLRAGNNGLNFDLEESSLDAVAEAARLPFRRHSTKVLLLITDAGPKLPDQTISTVEQAAKILKMNSIDQLHLVVPRAEKNGFAKLQDAAPGEFFDLDKAASGAAGFASILPQLSATIAKIVVQNRAAPPPAPESQKAVPPLPPRIAKKAEPPPAPTAEKAAPPPPPSATPPIKAVQSGQEFSADSALRLLLAIAIWTSIPACGVCLALMAGQSFYLKQTGLSYDQLTRGSLGGLAAGLIGGLAGQILFQASGSAMHLDAVFRILGWSLLGSLVGMGMSFTVPNFRYDKGLLGGALGGAFGAMGFLAASQLLKGVPGGDILGRLMGAAILGFFIGLMVVLVERAFRRVWLEIGYGGREIRAVALGAEPVSLGSKASACTIYVGSAPDIAFRYWLEQGKVICEDVVTRQKREMSIGEKQTVGRAEVFLKSGNPVANSASNQITKPGHTTKRIIAPTPPPPPPGRNPAQSGFAQPGAGQPPLGQLPPAPRNFGNASFGNANSEVRPPGQSIPAPPAAPGATAPGVTPSPRRPPPPPPPPPPKKR